MRSSIAVTATSVGLVLALAGCAGGDADPASSGAPSPRAGDAEAAPTASATASASATSGTSQTSPDAIAGGIDPYCEAARDGYAAQIALLEATDAKSIETGIEDDAGSIDVVNAAGARMLEAIATLEEEWGAAHDRIDSVAWDDAAASVTTAQADQAFVDLFAYIDVYARPEAEIVASVGSIAEYDEAMVTLLAQPGAAESIGSGAAAVSHIVAYTRARCGDLSE
ncbi:hypothetical protein [Demequina sp. NBRC 110055]|uniref:hypothetical protein n=1 Tax=Demequina sp. NBRC 110055 TaxID=1570344 RepID=UPI000A00947C|nr:hypothetical protein [Demequina sp. NBRC 110055]